MFCCFFVSLEEAFLIYGFLRKQEFKQRSYVFRGITNLLKAQV